MHCCFSSQRFKLLGLQEPEILLRLREEQEREIDHLLVTLSPDTSLP